MRLIEDLGMTPPTATNKQAVHYCIYECPDCLTNFKARVGSVNAGRTTRCKKCSAKATMLIRSLEAASRFSEEASIVHNNRYDYSLVEYVNKYTNVTIVCHTHGEFTQRPDNHKMGKGCPKCAYASSVSDTFIMDSSDIHNNKYDYSKVVYINNITAVDIICPTHGVFSQVPNSHKNGSGCPECATTGFNKGKPGILYYLRITYDEGVAYKIGITNRSVKERFTSDDLAKITIIHEWKFTNGADAYSLEQDILDNNKEHKYLGKPLLSSGNTELFYKDILFLD